MGMEEVSGSLAFFSFFFHARNSYSARRSCKFSAYRVGKSLGQCEERECIDVFGTLCHNVLIAGTNSTKREREIRKRTLSV